MSLRSWSLWPRSCLDIPSTHLLKVTAPDVVVSQGAPELASLVREPLDPSADYGLHLERRDLGRVLADQVTKVMPELKKKESLGKNICKTT